ncbi:MAG TPA: hypothetical protein V6C96_02800, partial [Vampirovibrionales bacterium]
MASSSSHASKSFSKNDQKAFQRILKRKIPAHCFVTTELASELAELALRLKKTVSCLVDRRGKVREYYVGDLDTIGAIKAQAAREGVVRLAQLRMLVASVSPEVSMTELLLLKRYKLDSLVFIHASKKSEFSSSKGQFLEFADYAQVCSLTSSSKKKWNISERQTLKQVQELDFEEFVQNVEEDLASAPTSLKVKQKELAIIVGLTKRDLSEGWTSFEDSFSELYGLATTAG